MDSSASNQPNDVSGSKPRVNWSRWAIIVSIVVNGLILLTLGALYISFKSSSPTPPPAIVEPSEPAPPAEPEIVSKPGEKAKDTVKRVLEEQTKAAAERTDEENLGELEKQGERLKQVSSEETINQIVDQFHSWAGTEERAAEPVEETPMQTEETVSSANFDVETAQFHDVKKIKSETTGKVTYQAILLDAQGRTMSMELPTSEGEKLYPMFKQMKQNPLMAQIYRKIVMPLIDKQLKNLREEDKERQ